MKLVVRQDSTWLDPSAVGERKPTTDGNSVLEGHARVSQQSQVGGGGSRRKNCFCFNEKHLGHTHLLARGKREITDRRLSRRSR